MTDLAVENERLRQEVARLSKAEAGIRAEFLKFTQHRMRMHGHCKVCEYVPADLKPYAEPATERYGNGG